MNWKKIESDDAIIYESPCRRFRIHSYDGKTCLAGIRLNDSESYLYLTADETGDYNKEDLADTIDNTVLIMHEFEYVFGVADLPYSKRFASQIAFVDIPYSERVAKGMRLLDKEMPGWEHKVNVETLDMSISYSKLSILGQLASYAYSVPTSLDAGGMQCKLSVLTEDSHWYGFNNYYDDRHDANAKLTEAWKNAIINRTMNYSLVVSDRGNFRQVSTHKFINGKTLQECIENLIKLADGLDNPVCYISEMGDLIEFREIKNNTKGEI